MTPGIKIDKDWILKPADYSDPNLELSFPAEGIPARVPGTVHTDLLDAGLIDDPFFSDNELRLQWISKVKWVYETQFSVPDEIDQKESIDLVFEGIDTSAEVYLNETEICKSNNMFVAYRFEISKLLKPGKNMLKLFFEPALDYAVRHKRAIEQFPSARHPDRVFIRKAQYSFGWDWGPIYPTAGMWRPVCLEKVKRVKIRSFTWDTELRSPDLAHCKTRIFCDFLTDEKVLVLAKLSRGDFIQVQESEITPISPIEIEFAVEKPDLWWPKGYGETSLYDLNVKLTDSDGNTIDALSKKVGIRTVKLDLESAGKPAFRFRVNDRPVYLKGANWIPGDAFLPRFSKEKYTKLISMAAGAEMNILRVWGGGIYEDDHFYELCDENGIMVWQDMMFACAAYPDDKDFTEEVILEIRQNVNRLQYHPSILIWCGNNENEWIWYRDTFRPIPEMSAYKLFHEVFPMIFDELDPGRPYWPSSPYGNEKDPNDEKTGNRHQWDVWSRWLDYKEVVKDRSLFVTEFGFQGPANFHTMKKTLNREEFAPQSAVFEFHNKQDEGPERLYRFLSGHLPIPHDMSDYTYLGQLNQAFALKSCLEHWRMRWPETAGSIIWQINDCWPVTSWSLIDSDLKPKLSYYEVKRVFTDPLIAFIEEKDTVSIKINSIHPLKGRLKIVKISDEGRNLASILDDSRAISNDPHGSFILHSLHRKDLDLNAIYVCTWYDENDLLISRNYFTSLKWKHHSLREAKVDCIVADKSVKLIADGVLFFPEVRHPEYSFSDGGFILLPGESKILKFNEEPGNEPDKDQLEIISLNNYLQ